MGKMRFELDRAGVRALLQSKAMGDVLTEYAAEVAGRAGDGFAVSNPYKGQKRLNVEVAAITEEAEQACLEDNVLLKALGVRQ